jgi:hypothetical protein
MTPYQTHGFRMKLSVGLLYMALDLFTYIPSISNMLTAFIMKRCLILSVSFEVIIWVSFFISKLFVIHFYYLIIVVGNNMSYGHQSLEICCHLFSDQHMCVLEKTVVGLKVLYMSIKLCICLYCYMSILLFKSAISLLISYSDDLLIVTSEVFNFITFYYISVYFFFSSMKICFILFRYSNVGCVYFNNCYIPLMNLPLHYY